MKNRAALVLLLAVSLWAADFWQSKPFTDWNDKDLQKMMTNSPWARQVSVVLGSPSAPAGSSDGRGRRGGGNSGNMGEVGANPNADMGANPGMGAAGARGGRAGAASDEMGAGLTPSATFVIRWQSALPVKQALMRAKYGNEVATSPEAKKFLESTEPNYVIGLSGLSLAMLRTDPEELKKALMEKTSLSAKGKDPLKPSDIQFTRSGERADSYFVFPKTAAFTLDDKEVEFSTKIGTLPPMKYKFHLKEMVYNGKLEL